MANESLKPFPRGRLEQELDSIPSSTEGVPALMEAEQPYEDYEINLYGKRYRVPSPPKNIAKATPKPDYSKINVYEAVSVMEMLTALPDLAQLMMGMRSLKDSQKEIGLDENGYIYFYDKQKFTSMPDIGNAGNSEEAISLADDWKGTIKKAWPEVIKKYGSLKEFPEIFPSNYLGKPYASAFYDKEAQEVLFWKVTYPIEVKPSRWEEPVRLKNNEIALCIKGKGDKAILVSMDYNWRPICKVHTQDTRYNVFVPKPEGLYAVQAFYKPKATESTPLANSVATISNSPITNVLQHSNSEGEKSEGIALNQNPTFEYVYELNKHDTLYIPLVKLAVKNSNGISEFWRKLTKHSPKTIYIDDETNLKPSIVRESKAVTPTIVGTEGRISATIYIRPSRISGMNLDATDMSNFKNYIKNNIDNILNNKIFISKSGGEITTDTTGVEVVVLGLGEKVKLKKNEVIFEVGEGGRSFIKGRNGYFDFTLMGSNLAAHEFCHAMGLSDRYNYWQELESDVRVLNQDFEIVPIAILGNPDIEYIGCETFNLMVIGDDLTSYQWNYIFSQEREPRYPQFTFFSKRIKPNNQTWMGATGGATLNLNGKGEVSTPNFNSGVGVFRTNYYNPKTFVGGEGGKNLWRYLGDSINGPTENRIKMQSPYNEGPPQED